MSFSEAQTLDGCTIIDLDDPADVETFHHDRQLPRCADHHVPEVPKLQQYRNTTACHDGRR